MKKWILKGSNKKIKCISEKYGFSILLAKILLNRVDEDEIKYFITDREEILNENKLENIITACAIIRKSIENKEKIRIVGDYDVDGITATTIIYKGLQELNADVDYIVPNRITDGYGINTDIVTKALDDGINLIITCDNGISAFEALEKADSLGLKVVLTDHHNLVIEDGKIILPKASVIINPKLGNYPFKEICGAMVAYKLVVELFSEFNINCLIKDDLAILAGIGTVCDVMPLVNENRCIVKKCIKSFEKTRIKGLKAIIDRLNIDITSIDTYKLGFLIGPLLNAAGRLDDPIKAVKLLTTNDDYLIDKISLELCILNNKRKDMTKYAVDIAEKKVSEIDLYKNPIIVLHIPDMHESLAGIVAGRIKEKYYRPTLIFTGHNEVKGSGRSITSYNLYNNLSNIKSYFTKFGGHSLAAGYSALEENIDEIRKKLNVESRLTTEDLCPVIEVESLLPLKYVNIALIEELERLQPYGQGNYEPIFAITNVKVDSYFHIGSNKEYLKLKISDNGSIIDAMCFNTDSELQEVLKNGERIDILFKLKINEWNDTRTPQLIIEDVRKAQ